MTETKETQLTAESVVQPKLRWNVQTAPSLEEVMCRIRQDASRDSLHYLVRSNTGHDGE